MRFSRYCQMTLGVLALCAAPFLIRTARADETVAAPNANAPEKIELRLHLQKGQVFDQVVDMTQKTSQTIEKKRYDISMTMRFDLHGEVLDVSDEGNARVRSTYRRVQFSMDAPRTGANPVPANFPFHYDSAHPPKTLPPSAAGAAALAGQSLVMTMSPEGKTLKTEGMEELVERMLTMTKIPAAMRAQMKKQLQASMGEQTQKSLAAIARYPDAPVGVGDKWQGEISNSTALPISLSTEYSLLSRQNGIARIGVVSKIAPNEKGSAQNFGGVQSKYSLSGNQTGTLSVDEKTGWTQSFEMQQRFSGTISLSAPGQKMNSWPIFIASTIRGWTVAPVQK